jgi:hypothetical protein
MQLEGLTKVNQTPPDYLSPRRNHWPSWEVLVAIDELEQREALMLGAT